MDYKEKYEQALERAKVINPGTADYEVAVKIFPELKESEDERMWKLIKKYAHYNISDMALKADHITREQLETWLEKQDEQKPAWSEEDEGMLQKTLSTIRYALSIPMDKEDDPCFVGSSTISWLKSIKQRMKGE